MKNIAIIGGTGFIGKELVPVLLAEGFTPVIVSRRKYIPDDHSGNSVKHIQWDGISPGELASHLNGFYGVINLAGEGITNKLWSPARKKRLLESRYDITTNLTTAFTLMHTKPTVLIQGSAVGYYGPQINKAQEGSPNGKGFLAELTLLWEGAANKAETLNIRTVYLRTGIVLSKKGGAFPKLIQPFKLFFGGNIGSANRMIPWIHIEDEVRAICFLLKNSTIRGAVNLVAPEPCRQEEFNREIATRLHRPFWLHIPALLVKLLPGGMGKEIFLTDQTISPAVLGAAGFEFRFKTIKSAMNNLLPI